LPVEIVLVSQDPELQKACREILYEILSNDLRFTVCSDPTKEIQAQADLHIWDVHPGFNLEQFEAPDWKSHIILLPRGHLPWIEEKGFPQPNLILKPFTMATLRALLEQACAPFKDSPNLASDGEILSLRADRDQLLQSLIRVNLKLQQYDHDRTNFLARATHDFRAPLTALSGYCGLLMSGDLGSVNADQREVLQRMHHSAKRLSRMANAMFQLSIRQHVDQRPNLQNNDIRECIEQSLHEMMPFLEEKQIGITFNVAAPGEPLAFERSQLEQVLINLLDNACKFTPRGGSIEIQGYPFFWERRRCASAADTTDRRKRKVNAPNAFRVDITDSGPGIPQAQLDWIFEEYTSYSGGQDRSGGGLGLAICKLILNQHQGCVWAENTSAGAAFSFVLPSHHARPILKQSTGLRPVYASVG